MSGRAIRQDSGVGFDYPVPNGLSGRMLGYFEDQIGCLLKIWAKETTLIGLLRRTPGTRSVATKDDVDAALSAVVSQMRRTSPPWFASPLSVFPWLGSLAKSTSPVMYSPPTQDNEAVNRYFDQVAERFVFAWATEIESQAALSLLRGQDATITQDAIDRALTAVVNQTSLKQRPPDVPDDPRAARGLRRHLRRGMDRLVRAINPWVAAMLIPVGGAGGAWALISEQLQQAGKFTALPIFVALAVLGVVVMVARQRD